ncbi:uncharacterized protein Pyn_05851 [Prunus yedoensis var. nudiflora]|uniref:Uncharacterized protein n=1 Tax=Prunus yedoensis var. nudiflora TaxID=2094558 RepID=A0A314UU55_PRUYE|nr:uncharacterized protein Pyn_05851 [Prunus yedoensis var. nudiflora]
MASLEDSAVLKLEGSSCTPTNNPILNPVVIQNDASAKKLRAKERGSGGNNGGRASLATAPPKAKEDETISNDLSQTLLTRSTHGGSSSTAGGDVTVEQHVEPGTEPILGESRPATVESYPAIEQPCAEPNIPLLTEPSTPSLSSSEVPPNTSSLNMPETQLNIDRKKGSDQEQGIQRLKQKGMHICWEGSG